MTPLEAPQTNQLDPSKNTSSYTNTHRYVHTGTHTHIHTDACTHTHTHTNVFMNKKGLCSRDAETTVSSADFLF